MKPEKIAVAEPSTKGSVVMFISGRVALRERNETPYPWRQGVGVYSWADLVSRHGQPVAISIPTWTNPEGDLAERPPLQTTPQWGLLDDNGAAYAIVTEERARFFARNGGILVRREVSEWTPVVED